MRRGDTGTAQQFGRDVRLLLPSVDYRRAHLSAVNRRDECLGIRHLAPRRVDKDGLLFQSLEKRRVRHVEGGKSARTGERHVQRHHVRLGKHLFKRGKACRALSLRPWGVAL